ncbi:MAG: class I adenylate-forming enzyme family protein [Alphaproteobacteria bacterium]
MSSDGAAGAFPAMPIAQAHALLGQPGSMFEVGEAEIRGVKLKVWKAAPPSLRDIFNLAAAFGPTREHLVFENERATVAGFRAASATLARRLIAEGVKKGDRVALVMRNLPEWPVAFWASVLTGAIVTPLNAWWTGPELEYGMTDSGASILICDVERYERMREHLPNCPALKKVFVSRSREEIADPEVMRLESVIGAVNDWSGLGDASIPDAPLAPDDDVAIFYTSGTTGKPKGAVISHRNIISNMFNSASAQARAFLRRGEMPPLPDPSLQKVFLLSVPYFHATGCFAVMIPALFAGHKMVMQRRWDCDGALALIQNERVTHFGGVPTIAWQVLENPKVGEYDLSSVESIAYGGAPSAPELVKQIKARFPQVIPSQGWGMTETSATATNNTAEDYERKPQSCGVCTSTGEAKIIGANGQELPRGEVGELWYRGPIVVRGYWNNPQATAETFVDGWIKTGDLARMDEEGFLYIVDRAKDMLIRGGENIYCVEVENALYEHPAVMDAAVIGRPHHTLGEEPLAVVHLKPGASATVEDLRHHAAQKLAAFKVPVDVIFWPETLPRNANGKIVKKELKRLVEERGAESADQN